MLSAEPSIKYTFTLHGLREDEKYSEMDGLSFFLLLDSTEPIYILSTDVIREGRPAQWVEQRTIEVKALNGKSYEVESGGGFPITPTWRPRLVNADRFLEVVVNPNVFVSVLQSRYGDGPLQCKMRLEAYRYDGDKKKFVFVQYLITPPILLTLKDKHIDDVKRVPEPADKQTRDRPDERKVKMNVFNFIDHGIPTGVK